MQFQRETFQKIAVEMAELNYLHYKEVAHYQDIMLEPDVEKYIQIDESGALRVFTARDSEEKLIGYSIFFIKHNLHYKSSLQAVQDVIFIHPDRRGFGSDFIDWCDEELKKDGVQAVYHHVKLAHNFGPMLERKGYELIDLIYGKRLD